MIVFRSGYLGTHFSSSLIFFELATNWAGSPGLLDESIKVTFLPLTFLTVQLPLR
jgi:hypothetical protein